MPGEAAERPRLAPSTWLVGQLDESALANPPWAVERARLGYIQMGELAYHVAEQADGERTVAEIAEAVTAALGRPVTVGDVHALIHTVLVPRGVVTFQDGILGEGVGPDDGLLLDPAPRNGSGIGGGAQYPPGAAHDLGPSTTPTYPRRGRPTSSGSAPQPPRERVIGRAHLEGIAAVLMWLFWPPVMLVMTGLGLAALVWLYGVHGLATSLAETLTTPILLPLALLLGLLATGLQPLGPMVALYSAGAQIERLRVRLSLRHPSATLDVSDDYGLSRWARLTVDVGGVYLQLVAAVILCAIGVAADAEFLFLGVTLLTLNMLRLLLPFGRPGADRLLADLLLVPEPLLYAEQAAGRLAPGNRELARVLPPLKRWGWLTIGGYLLATAIVLAVLALTALWAAPTVLATIVAALVAHIYAVIGALGDRDMVQFSERLLQTVILAVTTFVLAVAVVVAAGRLVSGVVAWSRTSSRRRLVALVCAGAALLLALLCWVPIPRANASGTRSFRPLLGSPYRALSPISRGTIFDLFTPISDESGLAPDPSEPPTVTNDIGTGVNQPPPTSPPR